MYSVPKPLNVGSVRAAAEKANKITSNLNPNQNVYHLNFKVKSE